MRYKLSVDFYKKEHKTMPIPLYQGDYGGVIEFDTNLDLNGMEMFNLNEAYLLIRKPNGTSIIVTASGGGKTYNANITEEMTQATGEYQYQLRIRDGKKLITSPILTYQVSRNVFSSSGSAVADEGVADEVVVGSDYYTYVLSNGYEKTVWVAHETVISAEKLNKIENELEKLNVSSGNAVHIGSVAPSSHNGIWIDTKDEDLSYVERNTIDEITKVLKEQRDLIDELYFINMNSLDAGDFEEEGEEDIMLDGGVF